MDQFVSVTTDDGITLVHWLHLQQILTEGF